MKEAYIDSSIQQETIYVAYAKAILGNDKKELSISDPLGIILVMPIMDKTTGDIIGFREARTQKKVIVSKQRIKRVVDEEENSTKLVSTREDFDIMSQENKVGGVIWDVFTSIDPSCLMGLKGIAEYFYKEEREITDRLLNIHEQAEQLGVESKKESHKKNTKNKKTKEKVIRPISMVANA